MLIKRTERQARRGILAGALPSQLDAGLDRRSFLRRSGLAAGSLAILGASFEGVDRAAAIGAWSGLGGVAVAIGPFAGGWLVQAVSWRLVFFINVPIAIVVLALSRVVPETRDPGPRGPIGVAGAALAAIGLGGVTWALIEARTPGRGALPIAAGVVGVVALIVFFIVEARRRSPMHIRR